MRRFLLPTLRSPIATALIGHALAAAAWWWAMPGGFAIGSPRFWVNSVFPPAAIVVSIAGLYGIVRRARLAAAIAMVFGLVWIAAAVSGRIAYPISLRLLFAFPLIVGLVGLLLGVLLWRATRPDADAAARRFTLGLYLLGVAAVALGAWLPWTQRGPAPSTLAIEPPPNLAGTPTRFTTLTTGSGRYFAQLEPTLTFISRSPDRAWSLLAPRRVRQQPVRRPTGEPGTWIDEALDPINPDGDAVNLLAEHRLTIDTSERTSEIDGVASLDRPVWSHLNSYALLLFSGHERLSVAFSPTGETRFDVLPSDYPVGRPSRFACLLPGDRFVVLEAASAEKGPFTELASAPLARDEPVTLTFFDGDTPIAIWTLHDFAAHASTAPSPTAGHGVPQNAIRFTLEGTAPRSPAALYVTLAGTGVGRGYDTVAHAPGAYRTRHTWQWLAE